MTMSKILFLDIDGVLLPGRAYMLPNQTNNPYVTVFDPCAVAMLNEVCRKQDRKIVLHSSWIKHQTHEWLKNHLAEQGVDVDYLHEDWPTNRELGWRYDRVNEWLARHPEVTDYVIVDDEPENNRMALVMEERHKGHLLLTDFDEGLTVKIYRRLLDGTFPVKKAEDNVALPS